MKWLVWNIVWLQNVYAVPEWLLILFLDEVDDYIPVSQILTFHDERQTCVNITIIDDAFLERHVEIFNLTLTRTEDLDERIQFSTDEGEIEITENDGTKL